VVDSVTAMLPKDFVKKSPDEPSQIGLHAKLVGSFVNWISKHLTKYNCALILINQMRANIKMSQYEPGPTTITTGGNAIRYFSTVRIRLKSTSNKDKVRDTNMITGVREDKIVSQEVKVVIEKNKLDIPFKSCPIYITFGKGIDNIMSLLILAVNRKVIKIKSDKFYEWVDPDGGKNSFRIEGKMACKKYLEEHPAALEAMQPYLTPAKDEQEIDNLLQELEEKGVQNLTDEEKDQLRDLRKAKGLSIEDLDMDSDQLADLASLNEFAADIVKKDEKPKVDE
jgi:recombination protein RecA